MKKFMTLMVLSTTALAVPLAGTPMVSEAAHVSCGDTIYVDTKLDSNLTNCPINGIIIGADGIKLDGNGHTINGQGSGSGIVVSGRTGVTVKKLRVTEFSIGISLFNSVETVIKRNIFSTNNRGIRLSSSSNNTIHQNEVLDSFLGIRVLSASNDNILTGNTVSGTIANAINLQFSSGNVVQKNDVLNNGHGISLFSSSSNTMKQNLAADNSFYGFRIISSSANSFIQNKSERNGVDGFSVEESDDNSFIANFSEMNGGDGFAIDSMASGNAFTSNKAEDNGGFGFLDTSSGGTGNAGTDSTYNQNHCRRNGLGGSLPSGLCRPQL